MAARRGKGWSGTTPPWSSDEERARKCARTDQADELAEAVAVMRDAARRMLREAAALNAQADALEYAYAL